MDERDTKKVNKIIQVLALIGAIARLLCSGMVFIALQVFKLLCFLVRIFIKALGGIAVFLIKVAHAFPETTTESIEYHEKRHGRDYDDELTIDEMMIIDEIWDD